MDVRVDDKSLDGRSRTILKSDDRCHIELFPASGARSFDAVAVTFFWSDIVGQEHTRFGVRYLNKNGVDVIYVEHSSKDPYQMLDPSTLREAVRPILHEYGSVILYGMNLGAYCALFYSGCLDATAIAFSPRLPVAHPVDLSPNISARNHLIVYDPFDRVDETFRRNVLRTIPDEMFFPAYFFGPESEAVLHEMGLLKGLIINFIAYGARPDAKVRAGRKRSLLYLRALAVRALQRGHPKLSMIPADKLFARAPTAKNKRLRQRIIALAPAGEPGKSAAPPAPSAVAAGASLGREQGLALPIATDGRSLYVWRAKVAAMRTGGGRARLMTLGDSWAQIQQIPQYLSDLLAPELGRVDAGWIGVDTDRYGIHPPYGPINGAAATSSGWTLRAAAIGTWGIQPVPSFGFAHDGLAISTTGRDATARWSFKGTEFRLHYAATGGRFRYRVGGAAWRLVAAPAGGGFKVLTVDGLVAEPHDVELDTSVNLDGATVALFGFYYTTTPATGVEVLKCGCGGIDALQMRTYASSSIAPGVAALAPDVIVLILGTNDSRRRRRTPATYIATLRMVVASIRAVLPDVGFIFVAPSRNGGRIKIELSSYRDALWAFCLADGHECYNLHDDWGPYRVEEAHGQWSGAAHVSDAGAWRIAARLKKLFLDV